MNRIGNCAILGLMFLLFSCVSKQDRMNRFVSGFNVASTAMVENYVKSIKAEKTGENEIKITMSLSNNPDDITVQLYSTLVPDLIKELIEVLDESKALVNDGVLFDFFLVAADKSVVINQVFDKASFSTANMSADKLLGNNGELDIHTFAKVINKGLPIVDTVANMTVLEVEIIRDTAMQWAYIIPDEDLDFMIEFKETESLIKDGVLADTKLKNSILQCFDLGVKRIYFFYRNEEGNKTKRLEFTKKDFVN